MAHINDTPIYKGKPWNCTGSLCINPGPFMRIVVADHPPVILRSRIIQVKDFHTLANDNSKASENDKHGSI